MPLKIPLTNLFIEEHHYKTVLSHYPGDGYKASVFEMSFLKMFKKKKIIKEDKPTDEELSEWEKKLKKIIIECGKMEEFETNEKDFEGIRERENYLDKPPPKEKPIPTRFVDKHSKAFSIPFTRSKLQLDYTYACQWAYNMYYYFTPFSYYALRYPKKYKDYYKFIMFSLTVLTPIEEPQLDFAYWHKYFKNPQ